MLQAEDDEAFNKAWGPGIEANADYVFSQLRERLKGWDNARVARLCRLANCTMQELFGCICGTMCKRHVATHWRKNRWPPYLAIHLAKFESIILQRRYGYVPKPTIDERFAARAVLGMIDEDES